MDGKPSKLKMEITMKHIYNIIPVAWVAVAILVFGCEDNRLNDIEIGRAHV